VDLSQIPSRISDIENIYRIEILNTDTASTSQAIQDVAKTLSHAKIPCDKISFEWTYDDYAIVFNTNMFTLEQASEEYGIAMLSENGEELSGAAQFRMMPVAETVTFTGVVEEISAEEKRIFLRLEFDETAPENTEGSIVCIKWDLTEKIGEEIADGTRLTATGALSMYENEDSEHNGCADLVLTDMANLEIR